MDEVSEYVARYRRAVDHTRGVDLRRGAQQRSSILREVEAKGLMDEFMEKMEGE